MWSKKHFTEDELISEIHRFINKNGRNPIKIDMLNKNGYISYQQFINKFGSWTNALIAADLIPNLLTHDETECCTICGSNITDHWRRDKNKSIICNKCYNTKRDFVHGILDPASKSGIGVITEYVVKEVLMDCVLCNTVDSFVQPFDLISKSLGTINVKSAKLMPDCRGYNSNIWKFRKSTNQLIPDNYICIGFDKNRNKILHVWCIPENSNLITNNGIHISLNNIQRAKQYEVDAELYNKFYQNLDIYLLPEFCNLGCNNECTSV